MKNEHRTRVQTARTRGNKGAASETGVFESNEVCHLCIRREYVEEKEGKTSFSLEFATFDFEGDTLFIYFFKVPTDTALHSDQVTQPHWSTSLI